MKILMLAPHPFYQDRGTPIAVNLLIRALSEQGHDIDLLTFNEGDDVDYEGLRIYRAKCFGIISGVRPGFSLKKLVLDVIVFFMFIRRMLVQRYDVIHAVEESSFMAMIVCPIFRVPYIYDMDSSMVAQMLEKTPVLDIISRPLKWLESLPMRKADVVIPVCDALADEVRKHRNDGVYVLKDVSLLGDSESKEHQVINIREQYHIEGLVLMYIGNLESYQGIDMMLDAFSIFCSKYDGACLVIAGGANEHIKQYEIKCQMLSIADDVIFMGGQPVQLIGDLLSQADILLSPRISGENTPMKVYSYLDSGVAVLATDLPTHTQVISEEVGLLVNADPESFAEGMLSLALDKGLRHKLAMKAKQLIAREHSYAAFKTRIKNIYHIFDHSARQ